MHLLSQYYFSKDIIFLNIYHSGSQHVRTRRKRMTLFYVSTLFYHLYTSNFPFISLSYMQICSQRSSRLYIATSKDSKNKSE